MSDFNTLHPLVAAGGNSRAARSLRARLQWRDRYGRWIDMGRGVKFKVRGADGAPRSVIGTFVGALAADTGQVYVTRDPNGLPDGFYEVKSSNAQEFVANLSEEQLTERGIELGKGADGSNVGERLSEQIPSVNQIVRKDAPEGWAMQKGTFGGKKVIETDDGDFRVHFGGKDETVAVEDHRGKPGVAEPVRSIAEAFKKVNDVDVKREESGDAAYTGLAADNEAKVEQLGRDDLINSIKLNERTVTNERASIDAKMRANQQIEQVKGELASKGFDPYDPEGADSDEAIAAKQAAPAAAAPETATPTVSTGDIDTTMFDVAPEGFLVPTGKITNDITPQGLANFMTSEKEQLAKGGQRLVIDTDAGTAEIHNSADTLENAQAQAGGIGVSQVLDLAAGKVVDVNNPDGAVNAQDSNPNAVEPGTDVPGADAPVRDQSNGEDQRTGEPAGNLDPAKPSPNTNDPGTDSGSPDSGDPASGTPDASSAPSEPNAAPGSVEDLKARRSQVQAALDTAGDPKDIIALNEQADELDTRIRREELGDALTSGPKNGEPGARVIRDEARPDAEDLATPDGELARDDPKRFEPGKVDPSKPAPDSWEPKSEEQKQLEDLDAQITELETKVDDLNERASEYDLPPSELLDPEENDIRGRARQEAESLQGELDKLNAKYDELDQKINAVESAPEAPAEASSDWAADPVRPTKDEIKNAPAGSIIAEEHNESGDVRLYRKREDGKWDSLGRLDGKREPTGYVTRGEGLDLQGSNSHYVSDMEGTRPATAAPEAPAAPEPAPAAPEAPKPVERDVATPDPEDLIPEDGELPRDAPERFEPSKVAPGTPQPDSWEPAEAPAQTDAPAKTYQDISPTEIREGDFIQHPQTGNVVKVSTVDFERDDEERDTKVSIGFESRNESEDDANQGAGSIELWGSDKIDTFPGWSEDGGDSEDDGFVFDETDDVIDAMRKKLAGEPLDEMEQGYIDSYEASTANMTLDEKIVAAQDSFNKREKQLVDVLLQEDYSEDDYDKAVTLRDWAKDDLDFVTEQRKVQQSYEESVRPGDPNDFGTPPSDDERAALEDEERQANEARNISDEIAEYESRREQIEIGGDAAGLVEQADDPENPSSGHGNSLEATKAKMQGKDLTPEERADYEALLNSDALSDKQLARIDAAIASKPNAANTTTVARPETEQPEYLSTADLDIVNAERDNPDYVFDEDLTWRKVQEENPDGTMLPNGDFVVETISNKGKRYDVVVRRTQKNRFLVYVMETDQQGNRRAKRISNSEWHSYEALENRITTGRKLVRSSSPAGSIARRKDFPTENLGKYSENLGTQNFPEDDFLGDIGNPDADVPETGDEKFDRLLAAAAKMLRDGNVDIFGIEAHLQELDPGANAVKTIVNAIIGRAQDNYRPSGINPFQMYDGETAEIGMHFDWTDWHQELNWWLPNGQLNPDRKPNPTHGLVGRGRVVGYVKENTDGKGHTYGDHVWVQMMNPDGSWGNWVKRSAQTLRRTEEGEGLGQPFFSKREEWRTNPEELARRFRVPAADGPAESTERPKKDQTSSRRLRFTSRGSLAGYSNVPVPNDQPSIVRLITSDEVRAEIRPASDARPGMMIARMDDDGIQHVDSIIRVENLGDGGYRIHAARPDGNGFADVDSFVVPGDAEIALFSSPPIEPARGNSEPTNERRGETVNTPEGPGVVMFDDGDGNLTVAKPGNETIDILESNVTPVEAPEVSKDERQDLMDALNDHSIPQYIKNLIQQGIFSPGLSAERYRQLVDVVESFATRTALMRDVDVILDMIGASDQQRADIHAAFNASR